MKKYVYILFLLFGFGANAQQSITSLMNAQASASGCGTSHFITTYHCCNYTATEVEVITEDSANAPTISMHVIYQDTSKTRLDTNFVLTANQVSSLNSFYQSASNNSNPDPSLTATHQGTVVLKADVGCAGNSCLTYNSNLHISLYRTLISNWNNWNH